MVTCLPQTPRPGHTCLHILVALAMPNERRSCLPSTRSYLPQETRVHRTFLRKANTVLPSSWVSRAFPATLQDGCACPMSSSHLPQLSSSSCLPYLSTSWIVLASSASWCAPHAAQNDRVFLGSGRACLLDQQCLPRDMWMIPAS